MMLVDYHALRALPGILDFFATGVPPEARRAWQGFAEAEDVDTALQVSFPATAVGEVNLALYQGRFDAAALAASRLAAVGDAWDNVSYSLEMDFAFPGRPSFMDVWLDVKNAFGRNTFRAGQYRQPIGMDAMTSVRELTFLERALPFAFLPFRQIGVMAYGHSVDENATWALSGFRFPTDPFGAQRHRDAHVVGGQAMF